MSEEPLGYRRLHFFKMFLTEDDWNARHQFHIEKHRHHVLNLHGPGIVSYYDEELLVRQRVRPEMAVEVGGGYAIDEQGRDIIVEEALTLRISRDDFYLPCTIYIVVVFKEVPVTIIRFKDGRRENKYFKESSEVRVVARPPEEGEMEIARVRLSADAYKITDARDPHNPKVNEIDLRYRRKSRVAIRVDVELKKQLLQAIAKRRNYWKELAGNRLLRPAAALAHNLGVMQAIVEAELLTPESMLALANALNAFDDALAKLIKDSIDDPWVLERPEWQGFMRNAEVVRSLLTGSKERQLQNLEQIIAFLAKSSDFLPGMANLYGNRSLFYVEGQEPTIAKTYPLTDDWERIKVWSAEFPEILYVDGMEWKLIDTLNMTDEKDEKRHKFRIHQAIDAWKTRQRLYYPDGTMVDDTGVAQEGGYAEYEIRGVVPDTHLAVIRMMDYARADYELEYIVNDQFAGVSQCLGHDRRTRWRNWPFVIPAWFVNDDTIRIKQVMTTAERDVNMFHYWFYQPISY